VGWQQRVNGTLRRTVGYELNRPAGHPSRRLWPPEDRRVLRAPIFIFSAARSGSTLLRMILGSHTQVYAPPELPLMHLRVRAETKWIQIAMQELELTQESLDESLWDRVLGDLLARSGKPTIAVKTPSNIHVWRQIAEAWPDARFVYLLRHPASAVASLNASFDPSWHPSESGSFAQSMYKARWYMRTLEEARAAIPGYTIRYEDMTSQPEISIRQLCTHLDLEFEPAMLDYGKFSHGRIRSGLGDASDNLRSGKVRAPAPLPIPSQIPEPLLEMCIAWGYVKPDSDWAGAQPAGPEPVDPEPVDPEPADAAPADTAPADTAPADTGPGGPELVGPDLAGPPAAEAVPSA
jgi:hypothetical protein